jgi:hypothetical protein
MARWYSSLEAKRAECWRLGIEHREALVPQYMQMRGLRARPFLKEMIDDLIQDVQNARLVEGPLPLDTYAQTEPEDGRVLITINSRIPKMRRVKDVAGVVLVTKCHESIHVPSMLPAAGGTTRPQAVLPGFGVQLSPIIVCRRSASQRDESGQPAPERPRFGEPLSHTRVAEPAEAEREFVAENAGLAMAIAGPDLVRCTSFLEFRQRAAAGGDLGPGGWSLLYATAECIGVNISALVRYFEQRGLIRIVEDAGRRRVVAAPQLFGAMEDL